MGGKSIEGAASRARLLRWYRRNRRDLAWRRTSDPYAIWVSEIMLQQTRVAAVVPYYERFMRRFPDVATLARAALDDVLAAWSGLGYYRRARFLHRAAGVVAEQGMPTDAAGLRALPGVGRYTAAAIASIAYGEPVAVVDGNVERVLSRLHAIRRDPARVRSIADRWVSRRSPGNHNQAVMELGATVCTPRHPACDRCPLRDHCMGRGSPDRYPTPRARPKPVEVSKAVAFDLVRGRVRLVRREGTGALAGMWDLPSARGATPARATVRHSILDRKLVLTVHEEPAPGVGRRFTAGEVQLLPLATAARKCLSEMGFLSA
jgi:A/G-specific adenine glycosylase